MGGDHIDFTKKDAVQGTIIEKAMRSAAKGGITGAAAQGVNVIALMWMRTTMNYQMANGGSMIPTIKLLYKEGGIPRFYRGIVPALIQSPISRFGDTFANAGALVLMQDVEVPIAAKTAVASVSAGAIRIVLMPLDAWKTNKQVHGGSGLTALIAKVQQNGVSSLFHGSIAQAMATAVGHWPWFVTYNYLDEYLAWKQGSIMQKTARSATIGLCASFVSDISSNGLRVLKTYRQTSKTPISYWTAFNEIRSKNGLFGLQGLFFRGIETRLISHGINSMVFTVVWKWMQQQ